MAKNKYAKLRVQVTIEYLGKSDKTGQKLKNKLEKQFNKKGISMFGVSVTKPVPSKSLAPLPTKPVFRNHPPSKMKTSKSATNVM